MTMKVAIDVSPLKIGHNVRGIGSYTRNLVNEFKTGKWEGINCEFFENPASPPPVDVIHYPYFDLFFHTLPIKKTASRVVTIHDVIPLVFPDHFPAGIKGYVNLFFQKRALKNTDAVICDSKTSRQDIIDKLSYPENKIHVVYLAPSDKFHPINDPAVLSVVTKKYNLPKEFVLYVGDVNWNKNLSNLLEAVKIAKVNLVMVGQAIVDQSISQTRRINDLIKKLGIRKKITKTGFVTDEELAVIYNLAKMTLLPSFYEGFGLPTLESMACGTLVVSSKVASIPEIAGSAAIYCNPSDPKDIARKVSYALGLDTKSTERLQNKSIKQAAKFNWSKTSQETIKVYKLLNEI